MRIHSNSSTTVQQRVLIRNSSLSCRSLTNRLGISTATVHKWRHRDDPRDRSCRPHRVTYALSPEEESLVLCLRRMDLPLDDIVDAVSCELPGITRSSAYRCLRRHGLNRLKPKKDRSHGKFREYPPGYLHIDYFYLPRVDKIKRYCFVAVDRATRFVYLKVYDNKTKQTTADFLMRCIELYPFKIHTVLTDNCRSFTHRLFRNAHGTKTLSPHPFEEICRSRGIDYRNIKPGTPKTNGMVERMIGLIQANSTKRHRYENAGDMARDLESWSVYYNFCRRHRRIGRKTPYQKACDWFAQQPDLFIKEPTHLLNYRSQCGET